MHRFYIEHIEGETASLTDAAQLHHLKDVLRLKVNDEINISDRAGNDYAGIITSIGKKQATIRVTTKIAAHVPSLKLTVACAVPKASRLDEVIDHLTQLGVERIIPMLTERVIVKLDSGGAESRLKRWRKIAQSAAQQSRQSRITVIGAVTGFGDVIKSAHNYDLKMIPHLTGERRLIKDVLTESHPKDIIVLIGPEGDFTPEEVALALSNDFIAISLGDTVLRVATAAVAAASYIKLSVSN
jgi:16S rRNA (uracil1498-N3)-methyltransferase